MTDLIRDLFGQEIRPEPVAVDREQFVDWIIERYLAKSDIDRATAGDFAEAFFDQKGVSALPEFGHPDWDWTKAAAYDLADEDMSYWEGD